MKTLDKQEFAKLVLNIYSNFLRSYHYDSFYDFFRLRQLEINNKPENFHLYFRRSGSDFFYIVDIPYVSDNVNNLHKTYLNNNHICLYVNYIPNIDHNSDTYRIQIIKDDYDFLLCNDTLNEN